MQKRNPLEVKNKILATLQSKGPNLPIPLAREAEIETLFAGAFLSELASEKAVKISHMKVGGSPLYYLPGQEEQLENFSNFIKGKEKEAFMMLKDKKILIDSELDPAIRVALRGLKDFALAITAKEKDNKYIFWRFHSLPESQAIEMIKARNPQADEKIEILTKERILGESIMDDIKKGTVEVSSPESRFAELHPELAEKPRVEEKVLEVITKPETIEVKQEPILPEQKIKPGKDGFLQEVQNILTKRNISIVRTESFDKKEVILRAVDKEEILVFAFNKKKINDKELVKCYKKALSAKLSYVILIKDELSKKMRESIEASKSLLRIEKL